MTERYFAGDRWRGNLATLVDLYRARRDAMLEALAEHFPADAHVDATRPAASTCG